MTIRTEISSRLAAEMARHSLTAADIARAANLNVEIVNSYLAANREFKFQELASLCGALGINFISFISHDYSTPKLMFRKCGGASKAAIQPIENAIQLIRHILPDPQPVNLARTVEFNDRAIMSALVSNSVSEVKQQYGNSIESVYTALGLQIIPVSSADDFEAFFFSSGGKYAVCINMTNTAYSRAIFSLLHELSHYIYDRELSIDVDTRASMFSRTIVRGFEPEFFATKFAQYFLIPIEKASRWALNWPNPDYADIGEAINNSHCSKEVAVNAILDCLEMRGQAEQYTVIQEALNANVNQTCSNSLQFYLVRHRNQLNQIIESHRSEFSSDILRYINNTLLSWRPR